MSAILDDLRKRVSKNISPIGNDGAYAYASPTSLMVADSLDEREMTADFIVVSKVEDREADLITPEGCEEYLDEYRANPVVLLEHDALKPVGLSVDKSGGFHFHISPSHIIARCHFHCLPLNGENLSEEVFRLVTKGVFRGASPGFLPIRGRKRGYGKGEGYEYHAWRLTEWSITSQPVNQQALRLSLAGVRCKSLRKCLESLVTPKEKSVLVVGGYDCLSLVSPLRAKSMSKPRTASIEFDKATFATESACVAWLTAHGHDASACTPLPASFVFKQRDGKIVGKKSLGTGVTALQTKAFGKDEDEEEKPKEKSEDKPDDKPNKDEGDDESDDVETGDEEGDEDGDEDEESEEAEEEVIEEDADPEALKAESEFILDHIAHWELALEHAKAKGTVALKHPEIITEMTKACEEMVAKLRDIHKESFAESMMNDAIAERKTGASTAEEDMPADEPVEDSYDDEMRKSLASLREDAEESLDVAKSLVA